MPDLDDLLSTLDRIAVPNLWSRIGATTPERWEPPSRVPRRGRIGAAIVAFAVFAAAGSLLVRSFRQASSDESMRPADPWATYATGWTQLPEPALPASGSGWVWTGTEIIRWGGVLESEERPTPSGWSFDPESRTWSAIPDAPEGRHEPQVVWTGREAIFFGGWDGSSFRTDGFAYDARQERWRSIPEAPLPLERPAVVVWTGQEMLVWGGGRPGRPTNREGAALDPASNSWRLLPQAPIGLNLAHAVWTGREMVVFGALLDVGNHAETSTAVGARYDPATNAWRELPPSDLSPQASAIGLVGDDVVAYDYLAKAQMFDLARGTWSERARVPLEFSECYPDAAVTGDVLFAFFCGQAATYDGRTGRWSREEGGMLDETLEHPSGDLRLYRFATLMPVPDGIVFAAQGITVDRGEPCYGCPGSPSALWFWRPPSTG